MLAKEYREGSNLEETCAINTQLGLVVRGVMSPKKNACHGLAVTSNRKSKNQTQTLHLEGLGWDEEILDIDKE